jgi:hypothetical protein
LLYGHHTINIPRKTRTYKERIYGIIW